MDAANSPTAGSGAKPARRKHRAGAVDPASQRALTDVVALALQGLSKLAAVSAEIPELELAEGNPKGEADILAVLPSKWLAKTAIGKRVARTVKDEDLLATLAALGLYATRIAPPVIAKWRENVYSAAPRQVGGTPASRERSGDNPIADGIPRFDPAKSGLAIPVESASPFSSNGGTVPYDVPHF